ncbi:MAG: protein-export chaperone SecB [Gammaproteobacteria bacterium]
MSETEAGAKSDPQPQQLEIQKIYLKDVSFEAPNSPGTFSQQWKPETNVQISTAAQQIQEGVHEVVLSITVTTKCEKKTAFLVEVKQAGVFAFKGFHNEQMAQILGSFCPNQLFPFAREAVSDLVSKGGFPQMLLAPINFDALYAQHLQQQQKQQEAAEEPVPPAATH